MKKPTPKQIEIYWNNIKEMIMEDDNFMDDLDMDDDGDEDQVNREADRIFEAIFGFDKN